jgi:hypothetical protein
MVKTVSSGTEENTHRWNRKSRRVRDKKRVIGVVVQPEISLGAAHKVGKKLFCARLCLR